MYEGRHKSVQLASICQVNKFRGRNAEDPRVQLSNFADQELKCLRNYFQKKKLVLFMKY